MTNQLNLTHTNDALMWTKLWLFSKIFLSFLVVITLLSAFIEMPSALNLSNIILCLLLVAAVLLVKFKKKQVPFIKIEDNNLYYFCPVKKEAVMIPANEIVKVSTQFCELQIHTTTRTHCLNLNNIKQEHRRWEIKETIKNLVVENEKRACGF
jgi:hypothetical protein